MADRRERISGQDGQNSGDLFRVRTVRDQHGNPCRVIDVEALFREANRRDSDKGAFGNSSLRTLREPPTFRGKHTMGTPRLKESS